MKPRVQNTPGDPRSEVAHRRVGPVPTLIEWDNDIPTLDRVLDEADRAAAERDLEQHGIKPDNIMLRDGAHAQPVLIDFGLTAEASDTMLTEDEHLGNRFLRLPELAVSGANRRDPRSDLTFVCGVLFYALTGEPPTHLRDENSRAPHERCSEKLATVRMSGPQRAELVRLFDVAFDSNIGKRWQGIDALRVQLEHVRHGGKPKDRTVHAELPMEAQLLRLHDQITREVRRHYGTTDFSQLDARATGIDRVDLQQFHVAVSRLDQETEDSPDRAVLIAEAGRLLNILKQVPPGQAPRRVTAVVPALLQSFSAWDGAIRDARRDVVILEDGSAYLVDDSKQDNFAVGMVIRPRLLPRSHPPPGHYFYDDIATGQRRQLDPTRFLAGEEDD